MFFLLTWYERAHKYREEIEDEAQFYLIQGMLDAIQAVKDGIEHDLLNPIDRTLKLEGAPTLLRPY